MSEAMSEEWRWSYDGERFCGGPEGSKLDALMRAREERFGVKVWVGKRAEYQPFAAPEDMLDRLLEQEGCDAYEVVGEFADSWPPPAPEELQAAAAQKIATIMRELVGEPHFYVVTDIEEFEPWVMTR